MKPQKYYWKVLSKTTDSRLTSFISRFCSLNYKIGEWTYPNFGKIYIFKTREDAIAFRKEHSYSWDDSCIFKVEAINPIPFKHAVVDSNIVTFWENFKSMTIDELHSKWNGIYRSDSPEGTYVADAIKLIEKVR